MQGRCVEHGLALGPDGGCVLCRREAAGVAASEGRSSRRAWLLAGMLLTVAAVSLVLALGLWPRGRPAVAPPGSSERLPIDAQHPRSSPEEQQRRGYRGPVHDPISIDESVEVHVPPSYDPGTPHGLLVWIHASPSGRVAHPSWPEVLARFRLIWAGPNRVDNNRMRVTRIRLALDAIEVVRRRYAIDPDRVYVSGFSGGSKSALIAQLMYPDVFRGGLFFGGASYFREVPARSHPHGGNWPARYEEPRYLEAARSRRLVLVTGPRDFNRGHMRDVYAGMRQDGLDVRWLEMPGLGHELPPADGLARAITLLEGNGATPPRPFEPAEAKGRP